VLGLGYVGCVTAACLADRGCSVVGVDVNPDKVAAINAGITPVREPELSEMVSRVRAGDRLRATTDHMAAVHETSLSLLCVGTPQGAEGEADLAAIVRVSEQIGRALATKPAFHVVVVRSTVPPGTVRRLVIPALERWSHKRAGIEFGVASHPEFLREGTAVRDFHAASRQIVGTLDPITERLLRDLYGALGGDFIATSIETAEMVKYMDNAWHALKVCFANEMGSLCNELGINAQEASEIFLQDGCLNISEAYLTPGFAFGGACLSKDVLALTCQARQAGVDTPLLDSILPSNARHLERALHLVHRAGARRLGILGLAFKATTNDLRDSPAVRLVQRLLADGLELRVHDFGVSFEALTGQNLQFVAGHFPELERCWRSDLDQLAAEVDGFVVAHNLPEYHRLLARRRAGQVIVDLVGLPATLRVGPDYFGLCW
jgi:GDP-mannose 6-dehydrogenase